MICLNSIIFVSEHFNCVTESLFTQRLKQMFEFSQEIPQSISALSKADKPYLSFGLQFIARAQSVIANKPLSMLKLIITGQQDNTNDLARLENMLKLELLFEFNYKDSSTHSPRYSREERMESYIRYTCSITSW